jgi:hypothetical protein
MSNLVGDDGVWKRNCEPGVLSFYIECFYIFAKSRSVASLNYH